MPAELTAVLGALESAPAAQIGLIILATFVLEDLAIIACGLLVALEQMAFGTALTGLLIGIIVGDAGLYAAGHYLGPRLIVRGLIKRASLRRAKRALGRHWPIGIIGSRWLPGARLPTYLAAGILRLNLWGFLALVAAASLVWTTGLLWLLAATGEQVLERIGLVQGLLAVTAVGLFVALVLPRVLAEARRAPAGKVPGPER